MKKYPTKPKDHSETVLRDKTDLIAVLAADLHFSLKPPIARSCHEDWLEVQRGYIRQLRRLSLQAPVIVAGDIFDRWNAPAELVNMLLKELPQIYACAGQHDLAHHSYEDIRRTSYWTLVEAGKIIHTGPETRARDIFGWHPIRVWGYPWGTEPEPLKGLNDLVCEIAVIHTYVWSDKSGAYPNAPKENHVNNLAKKLKGHDVVVSGDNHQAQDYKFKSGMLWFNAGGFQRRKMDERQHKPSVGLLKVDAKTGERRIERHYLDVSQDRFIDEGSTAKSWSGMEDLLQELSDLGDSTINFEEALKRAIGGKEVPIMVREAILGSLTQ